MREIEDSKENKVIRNWEEKEALCEKWRSSGLSIARFCKEEGLKAATFYYWIEKTVGKKKASKKINFLPVSKIISNTPDIKLEVRLLNGLICCFSRIDHPVQIKTLIQELQHVADHRK